MKGLIVMEILAFLELKRRAVPLGRDVILCLTADEEAGGDAGVGWLLANHPDEVACSEVLNEGGSGLYTPDGKPLMGIQTAERGSLWVRVVANGRTGHGSQYRPDSAPGRLIRALARLETRQATYEVIPETRPMLQTLAALQGGVAGFVLGQLDTPWLRPWLAPRVIAQAPALAPVLAMTVNTTVLAAGSKVNVVPGEASAEIDMRMLPGHTTAQTLAWLKDTLADDTLAYTVLHSSEPSTSPAEGPLYRSLVTAVNEALPGMPVIPIMTPGGGTDSAYFRRRGVRCYGFMPILASVAQISSIHGDDEFISVEQLASGTQMTVRAVALAAGISPSP